MPSEFSQLLVSVQRIAQAAGEVILPFHRSNRLEVRKKRDGTWVSVADLVSHELIVRELSQLADWPIVSEEGDIPDFSVRQQWSRYWIVDPLDGTRDFIRGMGEFTVNIALVEDHCPVLGVMSQPFGHKCYIAVQNEGAFLQLGDGPVQPIKVEQHKPLDLLRFVIGRHQVAQRSERILQALPRSELIRLSSALKFAAIAQGDADVYLRIGPISEWDTAAGQCILREAGGATVDFEGQDLQYNVRESLQCSPLLAVADRRHVADLIHLFGSIQ